jgi:hypothetical protein
MWAHSHSLLELVKSRVLDHSAAMTLGRMVLESFVLFSYLVETVPEEEREFRYVLLKYHDTNSRINFLRMQADADDEPLREGKKHERQALKDHPFFAKLTKEQRERCLSGTQAYVRGFRQAARHCGISEKTFNSVYGYLSAHSHSLPISLFRSRNHKIDYFEPSDVQQNMVAFAIAVALPCLLSASFSRIDSEPGLDHSWKEDEELRLTMRESRLWLFEA